MSIGENSIYGYGRISVKAQATGHKSNNYHLFASSKEYSNQQKISKSVKGSKIFLWSVESPFTVRSMALAQNALIIAGAPDLGKRPQPISSQLTPEKHKEAKETNHRLEFEDPVSAVQAFRGEH